MHLYSSRKAALDANVILTCKFKISSSIFVLQPTEIAFYGQ
jgi:hypothetical protein